MKRLLLTTLFVGLMSHSFAGDIADIIKSGEIWKKNRMELSGKELMGVRYAPVDDDTIRVPRKGGITLAELDFGESVIAWQPDNGPTQSVVIMVYNKGDDSAIDRDSYMDVLKETTNTLNELMQTKGKSRKASKKDTGVSLKTWVWENEGTFVATDAHKLVRSVAECPDVDFNASFILPKKPANLLKGVLLKEEEPIRVSFDAKNVSFELKNHKFVCRLIEGNYPNYNAVIPSANPNKVLVDRVELVNGIKRVAVCSNPTTNLIRMDIAGNRISLAAQDIDFSVSANETISCSYDGQPVTIGFKSTFLVEILSNIDSPTVVIELADSTRAGVFKPVYDDKKATEVLMLLMPMMINA